MAQQQHILLVGCLFCMLLLAPVAIAKAPSPRLNEIQVIHAHNSYHICPSDEVQAFINSPVIAKLAGVLPQQLPALQYTQPSITDLLNTYGVRSLEIDVAYDPDGGRYYTPAAPKLAKIFGFNVSSAELFGPPSLLTPGWKVQHIPDLDYRATCSTLMECLQEIQLWREAHPVHGPLFVRVEPKVYSPDILPAATALLLNKTLQESPIGSQGLVSTPPATNSQLLELEVDVLSIFNRSHIFTPDDLRGYYQTLMERVQQEGYPYLDLLQDKVIFVLVGPSEFTDLYARLFPNASKAIFFNEPYPEDADANTVFVQLGIDPSVSSTQADALAANVTALVNAGYLVRAAADYDTVQARLDYTYRRDKLIAAGVQFLHTDYPNLYTSHCNFTSNYTVELLGQTCKNNNSHHACGLDAVLVPAPSSGANATNSTRGALRVLLASACNPLTAPDACKRVDPDAHLPETCICEQPIEAAHHQGC